MASLNINPRSSADIRDRRVFNTCFITIPIVEWLFQLITKQRIDRPAERINK